MFNDLQQRLARTSRDKAWAHDYALQLLNRLMFLYFIQRKRWLGNNHQFIAHFWQAYKASGQPKDTFFDRWLSVLFFEAFNNRFQAGRRDRQHFPPEIRTALAQAPFLNGGLFRENDLDTKYDVTVPDDFFSLLFDTFNGSTPGFLERYNFTITESTPLDIEVAVDPEMIGKVYESLVNITAEGITEEDLRGSAGIFYTPRVEIDLMCRLALVDTLANHLGQDKKPLLYDAVFARDPDEKEAADKALAEHNLWPELDRVLRQLTICDPACGSGSFLVGMLLVLDDLQARANLQLGHDETPYERRRRIIGEQLYGVDVMEWAVHVAELRLWLQLVVETEIKPAELHLRPLLPNLSFKIRCGDSLVQEIGGINFGLHRHHLDIPAHLKGRITQLKAKKLRFYQGEPGIREADLKLEELAVFRDILEHKRLKFQRDIADLTRQIEGPPQQGELAPILPPQAKQQRLKLEEQWRAERDAKQAELKHIEHALAALRKTQSVPFVWDIAFVEIFGGSGSTPTVGGPTSTSAAFGGTGSTLSETNGAGGTAPSNGFDIVIGNPPYVRQEMIAPPALDPADFGGESSDRWKEQKKAYKAKLQESVAAAWPKFFRYKPGSTNFRKPDGKSDLYIYFYLHGLSLLNPRGSFCFITSNSWLDVGYGADLQEFLLKHSHVKFILDNERKRSFAQADVNTIIALLAPPDERCDFGRPPSTSATRLGAGGTAPATASASGGSGSTPTETDGAGETAPSTPLARFVMFKVPFEDVLDADTFKALEAATERQSTDRWRICVRPQRELLEEGLVHDEDDSGGTPSTASANQIPDGAGGTAPSTTGAGGTAPSMLKTIHIKTARYEANKWGGKYLRAPEIFFTILEKGKGKLVRLGDIAEVRRGFTTGANEFFYLEPTGKPAPKGYIHVRNGTGWEGEIEEEFLKPVIKSPRERRTIVIKPEDLRYKILMCHKDKSELKGTAALEYIKWGETQKFHLRPSCRGRQRWWDLGKREFAKVLWPMIHNDRHCAFWNGIGVVVDHNLFEVLCDCPFEAWAFLATTTQLLFRELFGRSNLGEGALKTEGIDIVRFCLLQPSAISDSEIQALQRAFQSLCKRPTLNLEQEIRQPDRRALDDVVFEVLGLT
ncbi:MAG: Eco57I restriction-modification methylase domain-containing protein, partial [Verrucomicrobiales bacterium]|nr:Eco57I restriction-modification methylase domain-containing protein [Verrucomicrobiales bacterium]